ncbi:MAG: hypothetical protein H5U13_10970 [Parvibaculum sp.]|nr:hypothetical protein [Parvibaculum sp.]
MINLATEGKKRLKRFYVDYISGHRIPESPHFDAVSTEYFSRKIRESKHYLEYGSGGSTLLAQRFVQTLVSVESNRHFLRSVRKKLAPRKDGQFIKLMPIDIGRTGAWGYPIATEPTPSRIQAWRRYTEEPWKIFAERQVEPDLILIDGRFRAACALVSILNLKKDSNCIILIDDYEGRDEYKIVERFAVLENMHGRMAEFRTNKEFEIEEILKYIEEYSKCPR